MKKHIILVIFLIMLIVGFFAYYKALSKKDEPITKIFTPTVYGEYKSGDIVSLNKEEWYVLRDSSSKDNYVTLIYKGILYLEENGISVIDYDNFNTSDLNTYLKKDFASSIGEDKLREVDGYKVRLFNDDDFKLLNVTYDENTDSYDISNCPDFICLTNTFYATMISTKDGEYSTDEFNKHLNFYNISTTYDTYKMDSITEDDTLFVRPVINVYKEYLDD